MERNTRNKKSPVKQNELKASQAEIKSLLNNKTWNPPQDKKIMGSKWTFKAKYDRTLKVQNTKQAW